MNQIAKKLAIGLAIISALLIFIKKQSVSKNQECITLATSAEYPPFEYFEKNEIKGFDIDLARILGQKLKKQIVFKNMQFSSILPALQFGNVDGAISTITITPERQKNFDFSIPYHTESIALIFKTNDAYKNRSDLQHKTIGVQLGTTMEQWLKDHCLQTQKIAFDNNNQAIEALKAQHIDGVLIDKIQATAFCKKNKGLSYVIIAPADHGYAIALPKNSALKNEIDKALQELLVDGTIEKLAHTWFQDLP